MQKVMDASDRKLIALFQREQLHRAAQDGDLVRVEELIQKKYPLNRFDELGKTPLHYAVQNNHFEVVKCLIRAGANVNAHDERQIGNTPLSDNARECNFEMAKLLIETGADPTIRGWMQMNAIDRAEQRTDANARKIIRLLRDAAKGLERPASSSQSRQRGRTAKSDPPLRSG